MAWYFSSWELRYCTALGMVSPLHSMSSLQILRGVGRGAGALRELWRGDSEGPLASRAAAALSALWRARTGRRVPRGHIPPLLENRSGCLRALTLGHESQPPAGLRARAGQCPAQSQGSASAGLRGPENEHCSYVPRAAAAAGRGTHSENHQPSSPSLLMARNPSKPASSEPGLSSRLLQPLPTGNMPRQGQGNPWGQRPCPSHLRSSLWGSQAGCGPGPGPPAPRPPAWPSSTHLELALEWPKDMSLLQDMGGMYTGSCLEVQEGGRAGHFLAAFWPLQVL